MLKQVVALLGGHHELRAEQTAGPDQLLHAVDELAKRPTVVGTVMPRAACPDRVARSQARGREEVLLYDLYALTASFELQSIEQPRRLAGRITRELDLAAVNGEWIAFDGDDAVAGGDQRQDESAVARADDRDGGVRIRTLLERGEELREEGEGVPPHAQCLHWLALLADWWRGLSGVPRRA